MQRKWGVRLVDDGAGRKWSDAKIRRMPQERAGIGEIGQNKESGVEEPGVGKEAVQELIGILCNANLFYIMGNKVKASRMINPGRCDDPQRKKDYFHKSYLIQDIKNMIYLPIDHIYL